MSSKLTKDQKRAKKKKEEAKKEAARQHQLNRRRKDYLEVRGQIVQAMHDPSALDRVDVMRVFMHSVGRDSRPSQMRFTEQGVDVWKDAEKITCQLVKLWEESTKTKNPEALECRFLVCNPKTGECFTSLYPRAFVVYAEKPDLWSVLSESFYDDSREENSILFMYGTTYLGRNMHFILAKDAGGRKELYLVTPTKWERINERPWNELLGDGAISVMREAEVPSPHDGPGLFSVSFSRDLAMGEAVIDVLDFPITEEEKRQQLVALTKVSQDIDGLIGGSLQLARQAKDDGFAEGFRQGYESRMELQRAHDAAVRSYQLEIDTLKLDQSRTLAAKNQIVESESVRVYQRPLEHRMADLLGIE